jgi:predicted metal-dependent enzyme (double-stranded beta helix superfamily)
MTLISDSLETPGTATGAGSRARLSRAELSQIVAGTAARADRWRDLVRYDPVRRWYHRMELTGEYEVWLLSWQPGQGTGFHDHGGSAGAFAVALGELQEQTVGGSRQAPALAVRTVSAGAVRSFGARFVHQVVNSSAGPAVSVHAYSPPLPQMRRYELTLDGLRYVSTEPAEVSA